MSIALDKSFANSQAVARTAHDVALQLRSAGGLADAMVPVGAGIGAFGSYKDQAKNRESYASFRNWLYSAINAVAQEAAGQPVNVGLVSGEDDKKKAITQATKSHVLRTMPKNMRSKALQQEYEITWDHPLVSILESPNGFQNRWQLVYSFVANLLLTGWSYIVFDYDDAGRLTLYSIPTTWVKPKHDDGPFTSFLIVNPKKPSGTMEQEPLTRDQVAFAYLPNPSDPLSALAPATTQMPAIRIDDYIQGSQEQHFRQGVFPSVIVTVGKNPHPDVPAGVRPRLTAVQRRQVLASINKAMAGPANYASPAIVDGLIERIDPFMRGDQEMGWAKSEDKVRTRMLSAFGVHPFILGEPVGHGGYAQVHTIEYRFAKRVNTYLDLLSQLMTVIAQKTQGDKNLIVWWSESIPQNPQIEWQKLMFARKNNDITRNELRAELSLPPDEDRMTTSIVGAAGAHVIHLLNLLGQGGTTPEQATATLVQMGVAEDYARIIAGRATQQQTLESAVTELRNAVGSMRSTNDSLTEPFVLERLECDG